MQQIFLHIDIFKNITIILFKIGKGLTQWDLVLLWTTILKIILNKHENVTNII